MSATSSKSHFVKLKNGKERDDFFKSLINGRYLLKAKLDAPDESIFTFHPEFLSGTKLTCIDKEKKNLHLLSPKGTFIVQFQIGDDKYLSQADYQFIDSKIIIDFKGDIFHFQRREDFRIKFPANYKAQFLISEYNAVKTAHKLQLLDISSGGCRIEIIQKKIPVKVGDVLSGELAFLNRNNVFVKGIVKHVAAKKNSNEIVYVGTQFTDLSPISKNRIFALAMDIYRELFSRIK